MENINEESAVADINALVENGLILLKRQFEKGEIEICTELNRQLEPVTVDPFALVQVFINIFNYSIASRSGRAEKSRLTVDTFMEKDKVVVEIQDKNAGAAGRSNTGVNETHGRGETMNLCFFYSVLRRDMFNGKKGTAGR